VLRVPSSLRDAVESIAVQQDRSLAYTARQLLERAVAERAQQRDQAEAVA
jgi:hypothetical protein